MLGGIIANMRMLNLTAGKRRFNENDPPRPCTPIVQERIPSVRLSMLRTMPREAEGDSFKRFAPV